MQLKGGEAPFFPFALPQMAGNPAVKFDRTLAMIYI
jgi:hypothetical protein